MTEKMKIYLDGLFSTIPMTDEVKEAKEELYAGMVERYNDYLRDGMDEQEAYDHVVDSIGDIRELFEELGGSMPHYGTGDAQQAKEEPQEEAASKDGFDLNDLIKGIGDFTTNLVTGVTGFISNRDHGFLPLVNTQTIPLEDVTSVEVSYIAETIDLRVSPDENLVVNEYMSIEGDPTLFAEISTGVGRVTVRNGRRQAMTFMRSRVEILLPASWSGSLSLSTVSGGIQSDDVWTFSSLYAKTISGSIRFNDISAAMLRLISTSGSVYADRASGTMELRSISGSVKVEDAEGGGTYKTTSGSVRVNFSALTGHVDASTVSGGVRLNLPADASFELDAKSVSGGIHTAFNERLNFQKRNRAHGFVGTAPYYNILVSSTSGSIHIND